MMDKKGAYDAAAVLEKLNKMIDEDQIIIFTPDEAKSLKEVATLWNQVKAAASLGVRVGSVLKWVVVLGASWAVIRAGLFDWIRAGIER
jgi:hypothetical protein